MPVAASPSYHGYDVNDYYRVNPEYGTDDDFKRFVAEAHRRGIEVLVDMVLNHASSEHPYFQEALRDTASPHRNWFRWSPTQAERARAVGPAALAQVARARRVLLRHLLPRDARPELREARGARRGERSRAASGSTEMGVDGFRLDAVPYLVEEGGQLVATRPARTPSCASSPRTSDAMQPGAFTVGEVWDSIGAMLPYYPDQLDVVLRLRARRRLHRRGAHGLRDGAARRRTLRLQRRDARHALVPFLRNHDQTRTITALGGDRARARVAAVLLLTLPGLPFVYYGEEIGMTGDKPDPRLRTPMQWTGGRAAGFTTGAAWEPLQPDSATANVAVAERATRRRCSSATAGLIHLRVGERRAGRRRSSAAAVERPGDRGLPAARRRARGARRRQPRRPRRAPVSRSSSGDTALPAARYTTRDLLGGGARLRRSTSARTVA